MVRLAKTRQNWHKSGFGAIFARARGFGMKRRTDGLIQPTSPGERRLFQAMLRDGWRPRDLYVDTQWAPHTCPLCGDLYARGGGIEARWAGGRVVVCSDECRVTVEERQALRRRILYQVMYHVHHRRVVEHLEANGWQVKQRQGVRLAYRKGPDGSWRKKPIYRFSKRNLTCRHPNVTSQINVYTGYQATHRCNVHIPPVRLDGPLVTTFYCYRNTDDPRLYARYKRSIWRNHKCICPTCQSLERIVPFEQAQLVRAALLDKRLAELVWTIGGGVRLLVDMQEVGHDGTAEARALQRVSVAKCRGTLGSHKPRPRRTVSNLHGKRPYHPRDGYVRPARRRLD